MSGRLDEKIRQRIQIVRKAVLSCAGCGNTLELKVPANMGEEECVQAIEEAAQKSGWKVHAYEWPLCPECFGREKRSCEKWYSRFYRGRSFV